MMADYTRKRANTTSLPAQIKDAQKQVMDRKRKISNGTATIIKKAKQQMVTPTALLLASGAGFVLGEATQRPSPKIRSIGSRPGVIKASPLNTALKLMASIQTLYTAMPIVWIMKAFYQPTTSDRTSGPRI